MDDGPGVGRGALPLGPAGPGPAAARAARPPGEYPESDDHPKFRLSPIATVAPYGITLVPRSGQPARPRR
eukprot:285311-Hanusia_phi.AAC.2